MDEFKNFSLTPDVSAPADLFSSEQDELSQIYNEINKITQTDPQSIEKLKNLLQKQRELEQKYSISLRKNS